LPLLCPFSDCSVVTKGPISILLCVAQWSFWSFWHARLPFVGYIFVVPPTGSTFASIASSRPPATRN
jgi:hypothetical protein